MTGDHGLEAELTAALTDRAEAVVPGSTPAARAAVDRRLRYRRRRRGLTAGLVVVLGLGLGVATGVGEETGPPDVVSEDRAPAGAADVAPGDDPVTVGLPRVALDPDAVGRPRIDDDPLVQPDAAPTDTDAGAGLDLVQVFRPADALLPVAFIPWGAELDLPVEGEPMSIFVHERPATWTGQATGWSRLSWSLPDGEPVHLYAFGLTWHELAATAEGFELRASGSGFDHGVLPPWMVARDVVPGPDDPAARPGAPCYRYRYEGAPDVGVAVWAEGDFDREVALLHVLAGARVARAVEVDGRPGLLAQHQDGTWSVGWSPAEGVTGALGVSGPDAGAAGRELAAAVGTVDADAWSALVEEGRRP